MVMRLKYKDESIMVTITNNLKVLSYKFQKLYYAIIIENCNRYSSISNKQRIDVIMVDEELRVLAVKRDMHENTVFEMDSANKVVLLPVGIFSSVKIGEQLSLEL